MRHHRLATLLLALALLIPAATAANFPGWQRTYEKDKLTLVSPQDSFGVVQLLLGVADVENGDPKKSFLEFVSQAIGETGGDIKLVGRSGYRSEGGLMTETLRVKTQGVDIDFLIFAYHTGNNFYVPGILAYVATIPDTDPRVNHALDFIATAARAKYRLSDPRAFDRTAPQAQLVTAYTTSQTAPAQAPPPVPAPPPQQSGKKCERRAIWGFRVSYWCQPSGICPDRVIKGYETVCE